MKRPWILASGLILLLLSCMSAPIGDIQGQIIVTDIHAVGVHQAHGKMLYNITVQDAGMNHSHVLETILKDIKVDVCDEKPCWLEYDQEDRNRSGLPTLHIHNTSEIKYDGPRTINITKE